jgi:hypothetical protein
MTGGSDVLTTGVSTAGRRVSPAEGVAVTVTEVNGVVAVSAAGLSTRLVGAGVTAGNCTVVMTPVSVVPGAGSAAGGALATSVVGSAETGVGAGTSFTATTGARLPVIGLDGAVVVGVPESAGGSVTGGVGLETGSLLTVSVTSMGTDSTDTGRTDAEIAGSIPLGTGITA